MYLNKMFWQALISNLFLKNITKILKRFLSFEINHMESINQYII